MGVIAATPAPRRPTVSPVSRSVERGSTAPRFARIAATIAAAATVSSALAIAPARAEGPVAACHWIDREYSATYTCEEPADTVEALEIIECWKYPAPARTYVRQKTERGWVRNAEITVSVRGSKGCAEPFPYRTVVTIPGSWLAEMTVTRVRLTMPPSDVVLPDGTTRTIGKTVVTYGACLMPEDAGDWCPER
jgi:hypothetical protein